MKESLSFYFCWSSLVLLIRYRDSSNTPDTLLVDQGQINPRRNRGSTGSRKAPHWPSAGHFASVQVLERFDLYDLPLLFGCRLKAVRIALLVCHNADYDTVVVNSKREGVTRPWRIDNVI